MNKKRLILLALALVVLAGAVGGSYAYFTDEETAQNIITTSGVDIEIIELGTEYPAQYRPPRVMPGDCLERDVAVKLTDISAKSWLRVKAVKSITKTDKSSGDAKLVTPVFNTDDWVYNDGYWYCKVPVDTDTVSPVLISAVDFSNTMDNSYQDCSISIDLYAQAVQWINNGSAVMDARGWPEE